jgi:hypothetical protein
VDIHVHQATVRYNENGGHECPPYVRYSAGNVKIAKLKDLSLNEWQVLLSSMFLLPTIALTLRLKGYKWTRALLQKRIPERGKSSTDDLSSDSQLQTAKSVARMVSVAAGHGPYRANCLKRSLATWWLLQRRGIAAELNIGVNTDPGDFNAHAWVEFMGNTLVENDDVRQRYSSFGPQ